MENETHNNIHPLPRKEGEQALPSLKKIHFWKNHMGEGPSLPSPPFYSKAFYRLPFDIFFSRFLFLEKEGAGAGRVLKIMNY